MSILQPKNRWTMVSQDDATTIEGQFEAQNVEENVSGEWAEQSTFGLSQPVLQFVGGKSESVTFDVKVFALYDPIFKAAGALVGLKAEKFDIEEITDKIRELPRADPSLGRPHVWLLSIGSQFEREIVVMSVGGIRYDLLRPAGGQLRGVLFSMEVRKYTAPPSFSAPAPAESLVTPAREGESYEHVAARVLRDPELGEALRRRNPDRRHLREGDLIHVPPARKLRRESLPLSPRSLVLRPGTAQRAALLDAVTIHSGSVPSHVVLEDF